MSTVATNKRLIIVSNRLPVHMAGQDGGFSWKPSAGGLATGMKSFLEHRSASAQNPGEHVWVGWPGTEVAESEKGEVAALLSREHQARPVFLSPALADSFYLGFCNNTVWPLFHYFYVYADFQPAQWDSYVSVNRIFCDEVVRILKPGDVVWVHDYQLMLLPAMLRERIPGLQIGFFLHIPFPSFDVFRLMPRTWSRCILEGIMAADLVGFHTHDYSRNFLRCVLRILGTDHDLGVVTYRDRVVHVDTFPMGINFGRYNTVAVEQNRAGNGDGAAPPLDGKKVVLSVDRLDYTKGILNRLEAFDLFLEQHPEWRERVVLQLVVVPSREAVAQYETMKQRIDQFVGQMNGRHGTLAWTPILYRYTNLELGELVAAYAASDVALVTPLRDGMNLVAKEYAASRPDESGVLVLSEMAGAACEMCEALSVNPNNRQEIADALFAALTMDREEQRRRMRAMRQRIRKYDIVRWAEDFLTALDRAFSETRDYERIMVAGSLKSQLLTQFARAGKRLVLTDYDGTLVGFHGDPLLAKPKEWLLSVLRKLACQPGTTVVLVSGRVKATLEEWLGSLPIGLVAEHGAYIREPRGKWLVPEGVETGWKDLIRQHFQREADRLPGSFVEEKDFSLVWHYRMSDIDLGKQRAMELVDRLTQLTANANIQVLPGNRVVEVRSARINKGVAGEHFCKRLDPDLVIAIGDDWTDEDLFRSLPRESWTIKVGLARSSARFALHNHREVVEMLQQLADLD